MTLRPTHAQTADTLTQLAQLTERLRHLEPRLRARATDTAPDGYPRQSGPGAGLGGSDGDPVGTTVALRLDHPHRDHLGDAHRQVLDHIHQARRHLEQAESAGRQALPPTTTTLDDGCISCARIKTWSPIHRAARCRFCSDWASSHDATDPPADILRAHHQGRRITTRLLERLRKR